VWWISFLDGSVFIVQASSLAHARMLAVLHGVGRVGHFAEGHFIDEERAAVVPQESIGRMLSSHEARHIRDLFEARQGANDLKIEPGRQ
jgi:hypothetical protein